MNRRAAPDVYLGVRAIVPARDGVALAAEDAPDAIEYAVEMRRFDEAATLGRGPRDGDGHAGAPRGRRTPARRLPRGVPGGRDARRRGGGEARRRRRLRHAVDAAARRPGPDRATSSRRSGSPPASSARAGASSTPARMTGTCGTVTATSGPSTCCSGARARARRRDRVRSRAPPDRRGRSTWRFLVMELHEAERPDLAGALVAGYRAAGGDPGDDRLLAFFAAYRARVRAKVALIRAAQLPAASARCDGRGRSRTSAAGARHPVAVGRARPRGDRPRGRDRLRQEHARTGARRALAPAAPQLRRDPQAARGRRADRPGSGVRVQPRR